MTHTEKYELPLIEGTDVIDYEPFNEGMGKIEEALEDNENLVQEAVDDVAELGDTLNQKMAEVDEALADTIEEVNVSLEQTTESINENVNSKLNRISKFDLVRSYEIPAETYLYGSESGSLQFPITSVTPIISRYSTDVGTPQNDKFSCAYASQTGIPVTKIDFNCTVEPTATNESYNGDCYTKIEIVKDRAGQSSVVIGEAIVNTSNKTTINVSCLTTANGGESFRILFRSNYSHQVVGKATLTTENVGMNN